MLVPDTTASASSASSSSAMAPPALQQRMRSPAGEDETPTSITPEGGLHQALATLATTGHLQPDEVCAAQPDPWTCTPQTLWQITDLHRFCQGAGRLGIVAVTRYIAQELNPARRTIAPAQAARLVSFYSKGAGTSCFQALLDALRPHLIPALRHYQAHWTQPALPPMDDKTLSRACSHILARLHQLRPRQIREWTEACEPIWRRTWWARCLFGAFGPGARMVMAILQQILQAANALPPFLAEPMLGYIADGLRQNSDRFAPPPFEADMVRLTLVINGLPSCPGGNAVLRQLMRITGDSGDALWLSDPDQRENDLLQITATLCRIRTDDSAPVAPTAAPGPGEASHLAARGEGTGRYLPGQPDAMRQMRLRPDPEDGQRAARTRKPYRLWQYQKGGTYTVYLDGLPEPLVRRASRAAMARLLAVESEPRLKFILDQQKGRSGRAAIRELAMEFGLQEYCDSPQGLSFARP